MSTPAPTPEEKGPQPAKRGKISDRRNRCRIQCEGLSCALGPIVGISSTGMRVRGRGRIRIEPEQVLAMTIHFLGGQTSFKARVVWTRRIGLFTYEAGFEFRDMSEEQTRELTTMAQASMPRLLMRRGPLDDVPNH